MIYNISFSEYSTFIQCPHKWYLTYCLGLSSPTNEELIFGQCMHKCIEQMLTKSYLRTEHSWTVLFKDLLKKELSKVKDDNFLKKFLDQNLSVIYVRKGVELLKELDFYKRFRDYDVLFIEYKLDGITILKVKDIEFKFKGYIDLVLQHKKSKKYLFIDWKTSGKEWDIKKKLEDNNDLFAQLGLYKMFFAKKESISLSQIECSYYNLPRKEPKKQNTYSGNMGSTYLKFLFEKFQDVCEEIAYFDPSHLKKAKFMNVKNYCHRCSFNVNRYCDDENEFQLVM